MRGDIFGRRSYRQYDDLRKRGFDPEQYVQDNWSAVPATAGKRHNFDALGGSELETRANPVQGSTPLGYVSDNFVAIQARTEEVLRAEARIERLISLKTDIPEGARSFGIPVIDATGEADFIDNFGTNAPTISVGQELETGALHLGGNVAQYSDEELRAAQFVGIPLSTLSVDIATRRCMRHMERVALTGTDQVKGLLNQTTGTGASQVRRRALTSTFEASNGETVAEEINKEIAGMVDETTAVIGDVITGEIVVGLPPIQYGQVKSQVVTNVGSDLSVADFVMQHNGWTDEARGNTIRFERLAELKTAGSSNATRMLVTLRSPLIAEFPVAIMPRVKTAVQAEYGVRVPLEYKIGLGAFVARPAGIRYVDSI